MHPKKLRRFHRRIGTCRKNKTRKKHVFAQYLVFFWRKSLNLDWVKKFEKNRNLELQKQKKQQKIAFFFFVVYAVEIFVLLQLKVAKYIIGDPLFFFIFKFEPCWEYSNEKSVHLLEIVSRSATGDECWRKIKKQIIII